MIDVDADARGNRLLEQESKRMKNNVLVNGDEVGLDWVSPPKFYTENIAVIESSVPIGSQKKRDAIYSRISHRQMRCWF